MLMGGRKQFLYSATKKTSWLEIPYVRPDGTQEFYAEGKKKISHILGSVIEYRENIRIPKAE